MLSIYAIFLCLAPTAKFVANGRANFSLPRTRQEWKEVVIYAHIVLRLRKLMGNFVTLEAYKPKYSLEPHLSKPLEKFIIIIKCCIVSNSDEFLSQIRPYKARALL